MKRNLSTRATLGGTALMLRELMKGEIMTDLEVCRLSAVALFPHAEVQGLQVWAWRKWPDPQDDGGIALWNPLTIAEQRDECEDWLLACKYQIIYNPSGLHCVGHLKIACPKNEVAARAVAELQARKEKA